MTTPPLHRRPVLAIIGNAGKLSDAQRDVAFALGRAAVDAGFRIVSGGMDGVMLAAAQGAHASSNYREGDTIGIGKAIDCQSLNAWIDVAIPTGLGFARNMLVVATGDVVAAVGGGSGTLSEIALAWQIGRPVLAYTGAGGWAEQLAGTALDHRSEQTIEAFSDVEALVEHAHNIVLETRQRGMEAP